MALTDNLVAYYKLDESSGDAADSSGNSRTLTQSGSGSYTAGKINNGFNGGTTYAHSNYLTRGDILGLGNGNFTISAWVKINTEISSAGSNIFTLSRGSTVNDLIGFEYQYNGGTRRLYAYRLRVSVATDAVPYNVTLGTTNWNFATATWNGTTYELYFNGSSVGTVASSGNGAGTYGTSFTLLGGAGGGNGTAASVDEVGVWSRALTGTEITELYNSGSGLQYPFSAIPTNTGNMFLLF